MTRHLFRDDPYARSIETTVVAVTDRGGLVLEATNFYPSAGGQPGDQGTLSIAGAAPLPIATTVYDGDKTRIVHVPSTPIDDTPAPGTPVRLDLDWNVRHRHMRMHSALHLLCSLVPFPVTGGQIGAEESRLDFDIADADAVDKDVLTAKLAALVAADHPIADRWITDEELAAAPQLVRTMSVKPPMGSGRVRLVAIGVDGSVDLQPCGGTHVRRTAEIGAVAVIRSEKKGKQNRRIRIAFAG